MVAATIHQEVKAIRVSSTVPNTRVAKVVTNILVEVEEGISVVAVDAMRKEAVTTVEA